MKPPRRLSGAHGDALPKTVVRGTLPEAAAVVPAPLSALVRTRVRHTVREPVNGVAGTGDARRHRRPRTRGVRRLRRGAGPAAAASAASRRASVSAQRAARARRREGSQRYRRAAAIGAESPVAKRRAQSLRRAVAKTVGHEDRDHRHPHQRHHRRHRRARHHRRLDSRRNRRCRNLRAFAIDRALAAMVLRPNEAVYGRSGVAAAERGAEGARSAKANAGGDGSEQSERAAPPAPERNQGSGATREASRSGCHDRDAHAPGLLGWPTSRSRASRARDAALRFAAQAAQTVRSGRGSVLPHRGHRPAAMRAAVRFLNRSRSRALPTSGSA